MGMNTLFDEEEPQSQKPDTEISKQCKKALQKYLMASFMYYTQFESLISDQEYDHCAKFLLEHWDEFDHQHKHMVTKEDLQAGTLFSKKEEDYPRMVVGGAFYWADLLEKDKKWAGE